MTKNNLPEIGKRYKCKGGAQKIIFLDSLYWRGEGNALGADLIVDGKTMSSTVGDDFFEYYEELPPEEPSVKESLSAEKSSQKYDGIDLEKAARGDVLEREELYYLLGKYDFVLMHNPDGDIEFTNWFDKEKFEKLLAPRIPAIGHFLSYRKLLVVKTDKKKIQQPSKVEASKEELRASIKHFKEELYFSASAGHFTKPNDSVIKVVDSADNLLNALDKQNKSSEKIDELEMEFRKIRWSPSEEFIEKCKHGERPIDCKKCYFEKEEKPLWKAADACFRDYEHVFGMGKSTKAIKLLEHYEGKFYSVGRVNLPDEEHTTMEKFLPLTDFINDHENLKQRVKKLEQAIEEICR